MNKKAFRSDLNDLCGVVIDGRPIVIVDDDPNLHLIIKHVYSKSNKTNPLLIFDGGEELLAHMDKVALGEEEVPEVILLDINMPTINGYDVLKRIKSIDRFKEIPVIVMFTSSDSGDDVEKAEKLGADGFYTKPSRLEGFIELFNVL